MKTSYHNYSETGNENKLKMVKGLNVRPETMKLLEENIGRTHFDINCRNIFFDLSPKAKEKTSKNKQMGPN